MNHFSNTIVQHIEEITCSMLETQTKRNAEAHLTEKRNHTKFKFFFINQFKFPLGSRKYERKKH